MTFKNTALSAAVFAALAIAVAGPALAKAPLSLNNSRDICEAAVRAQTPAPKSANVDASQTRANNETVVFTLRVRNADDSTRRVTCSVDRQTSTPTIAPAS